MDVGLGSPGMFLLLTGGLAAMGGKALARRDGPTALAMGVAAVVAGQAAGLSVGLLTVAWTVIAIGLIAAAGTLAVRWLTGARIGLVAGMMLTCAMLGVAATQGGRADAGEGWGAAPLTLGLVMHHEVATLIGG